MHDVNGWLMALAFLVGLVLTFALMVRKVTREVPITCPAEFAAGAAGASIGSIDDVPAGPYGKGSAEPNADGSGPVGWAIKGNADSMLYHPVDSPSYEVTIAEVWFFDEASARAAGFERWDKNLG